MPRQLRLRADATSFPPPEPSASSGAGAGGRGEGRGNRGGGRGRGRASSGRGLFDASAVDSDVPRVASVSYSTEGGGGSRAQRRGGRGGRGGGGGEGLPPPAPADASHDPPRPRIPRPAKHRAPEDGPAPEGLAPGDATSVPDPHSTTKRAPRPVRPRAPTAGGPAPAVDAPPTASEVGETEVGETTVAAVAARSAPKLRQRRERKKEDPQPRPPPAHPDATSDADADSDSEDDGRQRITCVVCADKSHEIAWGGCGHRLVCATCALRMRLCFNDHKCPQCRAEQPAIVLARASTLTTLAASFDDVLGGKVPGAVVSRLNKWAPGCVFIRGASEKGLPLLNKLQRVTSTACSLCDAHGRHPLPSHAALVAHVEAEHQRHLCGICLQAKRVFPLELPTYGAPEMQAHVEDAHPECEFCTARFFDADELFQHMRMHHTSCYVCVRGGIANQYFRDARTLGLHMREFHHVWCVRAFFVFCICILRVGRRRSVTYVSVHVSILF